MAIIGAVAIGAIVVMAGLFIYGIYLSPRPAFFQLHLHVTNLMNMGNVSVNGKQYDVLYAWLNVSVPQNALAKVTFNDYPVICPGYPVYNATRQQHTLNAWMPNNETVSCQAVVS